MKTRTTTIMLLILLFTGMIGNAQLLKKITKSAERAAERAVLKKTEQKASQTTEKAIDGLFNMEIGQMGHSNMDPSILPDSYSFEWRYTLQMKQEKGSMNMHYYLREGGTDFASKMDMQQQTIMGGMLMVIDQDREVTTILMNSNGKKQGQIISSATIDIDKIDTKNSMDDYEFKEIGTKKILGYTCQGFQMENKDVTMTMYVAFDTPVSLNKVYGNNPKRLPKGFDPKWLDKIGENSLMMEMDIVHKKKSKHSAKMTCVALKKEPLTINISDYEFPQMKKKEQ